ncbi:hypothetical protein [Frankia sp. AgB32]|uniref:hypothetical protein n=1 Tax=Frankia sp. AgB32 TaxID=631119 RepID=UPI00200E22E1|nr:hypothetical protein [Frankia sp. AgB32]MCK9894733.1 hypothetical protein [Frankia sp. AgB32]
MIAIVMGPAAMHEAATLIGRPPIAVIILVNAARVVLDVLDRTATRATGGYWSWPDITITVGEQDPDGAAELVRRIAQALDLDSDEVDDIGRHLLRDLRVTVDPGRPGDQESCPA